MKRKLLKTKTTSESWPRGHGKPPQDNESPLNVSLSPGRKLQHEALQGLPEAEGLVTVQPAPILQVQAHSLYPTPTLFFQMDSIKPVKRCYVKT